MIHTRKTTHSKVNKGQKTKPAPQCIRMLSFFYHNYSIDISVYRRGAVHKPGAVLHNACLVRSGLVNHAPTTAYGESIAFEDDIPMNFRNIFCHRSVILQQREFRINFNLYGWYSIRDKRGKENLKKEISMSAEAFKIAIPQATLDDLRDRLGQTHWPDEVEGADWDYGTNLAYLKTLVDYWQHSFDWRAQEQAINRFAHFRANIDGFHIHFIHERGKGPQPLPLLLLHGWPSSFVQMLKIIPLLTDPARYGGDPADSFDVIAASLPGYGFSDQPTRPGMSAGQMAALFARLMTDVLGYSRYAAR